MKALLLFVFVAAHAKPRNVDPSLGTLSTLEPVYSFNVSKTRTYKPSWEDLDNRPLPQWYDNAKIGIMVHWGVYSVPSFKSEWFWQLWKNNDQEINDFMFTNYNSGFGYQEFAPMLSTELFNADEWATLFAKAGAKYVVLTAKHHDGFALFQSKYSFNWNSVDLGPKMDIVKSLSKAVKKSGLKFGVYYSLYEWFHPLYLDDKEKEFNTSYFTDNKVLPEIKQIVNEYKPSILISDGDWEANDTYWKSPQLLTWLYNESPVKNEIVVNDRWGRGTNGSHGDFYNTQNNSQPDQKMTHKWEYDLPLDVKSWGYRRNMMLRDVMTINEIISTLVTTVSRGGNVLLNVGAMKDGVLDPIFQERLLQLGEWLEVNGEAVYNSSPWLFQNDGHNKDVWYTCNKLEYNGLDPVGPPRIIDKVASVYAIFLKWPAKNLLTISDLHFHLSKDIYQVEMLAPGHENKIVTWQIKDKLVDLNIPEMVAVSTKYAWTLKISAKPIP